MITFTVPLPPRECSSNGRHHWRAKAAATRQYRGDVYLSAFVNCQPRYPTITNRMRVHLTFCIKGGQGIGYQPRDIPNAVSAFKAGFDGLVDAGLLVDDSAKHMQLGDVAIVNTRGPFVEVRIEPLEARE